jgi:hypothetical protein
MSESVAGYIEENIDDIQEASYGVAMRLNALRPEDANFMLSTLAFTVASVLRQTTTTNDERDDDPVGMFHNMVTAYMDMLKQSSH